LCGQHHWTPAHLPGDRRLPDPRDNAAATYKARIYASDFDWAGDRSPATAWSDSVIYELHVKGFTAQHPEVPPELRGRFLGLASAPVIDYLRALGVTAVELLPVQAFVDERFVAERGLSNYWGYNPIAWYAPHPCYGTPDDFKRMVKSLHGAGFEVLLDVVFNHTAEGGADGPLYHFKGQANRHFYRLSPDADYINDTGCGNTLATTDPNVVDHILGALRYWVTDMHVDGFRFDLATVLGRGTDGFDVDAPLLRALRDDPCLSQAKLIAEPWDLGPGGYQLGNFPAPFAEWNGRFRDDVRDVWLTRTAGAGLLAQRLTASADVFRHSGRAPPASINLITSHDGFTLRDLVSYEQKHNLANGEDNRDGHADNRNWNAGVEGPTDDPEIQDRRLRLRRSLLTCLLVAQGTPMLCAGDESGRTQHGNNNAYCQDNPISWLDWSGCEHEMLTFTRTLLTLRHDYACLRQATWFESTDPRIRWLRPDGEPMHDADWEVAHPARFTLALDCKDFDRPGSLLILFNADDRTHEFRLTPHHWLLLADSATGGTNTLLGMRSRYRLGAHGVAVLKQKT
jgi:glycogen operon protein